MVIIQYRPDQHQPKIKYDKKTIRRRELTFATDISTAFGRGDRHTNQQHCKTKHFLSYYRICLIKIVRAALVRRPSLDLSVIRPMSLYHFHKLIECIKITFVLVLRNAWPGTVLPSFNQQPNVCSEKCTVCQSCDVKRWWRNEWNEWKSRYVMKSENRSYKRATNDV